MGESACVMRSFSHLSENSLEAKQGDPFRALGESISFGRFMTEPLAWEKWSAFSHNRYLEEAEKFSKPGSVAQKKAYFEAHYKRKAAEREAALLETVNAVTSNVSESVSESVIDRNSEDSSPDSYLVKGENHMDEQLEKNDRIEVVYSANMNGCNSNVERNELDFAKVEGEEAVAQEGIDVENSNIEISIQFVNREDHHNIVDNVEEKIPNHGLDVTHIEGADLCFENSNKVEISNQFVSKENHHYIVANIEEKILNKENASQETENLALTSKKRLINTSSKLLTQSKPSKVLLSSAKQGTFIQVGNGNVIAPRSKKPVEDSADKKKLREKSVHKSYHYSSHFVESNMTTLSATQKFENSRISTSSLNMSKNSSSPPKTITRASVNRVLKRPSVDLKAEDRRIKSLLSKSVAGGVTADQKWNSLSTHHSKSSSGNGSKIRSSMIFSPFSFKSEERAAKRKEFFQKLEEKRIAEDAENNKHLETRLQEKTVQDAKKMRHNTGLKARQDEDLFSGSQFPSNQMKKIPLTRPRSPKLGRKETSSKIMDSSSLRPSANTKSPKCVVEKSKQNSNRSVTSRPQKNAHENASPNIQS